MFSIDIIIQMNFKAYDPFFYLFIIMLIFSSPSLVACEEVDLSDKINEVVDQKNTPWCYAFVASDLASFYQENHVSVVDLALKSKNYMNSIIWNNYLRYEWAKKYDPSALKEYSRTEITPRESIINVKMIVPPSTMSGGFAIDALKAAKSKGLCLYKSNFEDAKIPSLTGGFKESQKIYTSFEEMYNLENACDHSYRWASFISRELDIKYMFPGINIQDIEKILVQSIKKKTPDLPMFQKYKDFLYLLNEVQCHDKTVPFKEDFVERAFFRQDKNKGIETIHKSLDLGHPLGISLEGDRLVSLNDGGFFRHVMTIIGRKHDPVTKECVIKIKNSWGKDCNQNYRNTIKCKEGFLFIKDTDLFSEGVGYMTSLTYNKKVSQ